MRESLASLAFTLFAFGGGSYYAVEHMGFPGDVVYPAAAIAFAFWFVFWFAWAFRWVVVLAPVTATYIMFTFYGFSEDIVGAGAIVSGVLLVLTGIQQYFGNRKRKKQEKERRKELKKLKRSLGE